MMSLHGSIFLSLLLSVSSLASIAMEDEMRAIEDSSDAYRALVKNLPKIKLGGNSGYKNYRKLVLTGNGNSNTIFPVVSDDNGFANIAAGKYGRGKFLVFPFVEKNLLSCPALNTNTQWRQEPETIKNIVSMEECSSKCREKSTCNYWSWHHKDAGKWAFQCMLMSGYGYTKSSSSVISGDKNCNPGDTSKYCVTDGGKQSGRICIFPFIYGGKEYNECTSVGDSNLWCATLVGDNGEYVKKQWGYCASSCKNHRGGQHSSIRNEDKFGDWKTLLFNAIEWMTKKKIPNLASYPEFLNAEMLSKIKRVKPDDLVENVDVYIITNYRNWSPAYAATIENYLQAGGNLILGSSDSGSMRSFFLKLGFWDAEPSLVQKTVDTNVMPSSDIVFSKAVRSTIDNLPPKRDITSLRSKTIVNFMTFVPSLWRDIIKAPIYKDVLKPLFLKIVEEPALDDHFPDFGSYFQYVILPIVIQEEDLKSPILTSKLYTPFPQKVEDSAQPQKKVVTINGTYILESIFDSIRRGFTKKWLSTGLYAKQGQLITVKVPEHVVGKFGIQVGSHTDDLFRKNKNLKRWMKGDKLNRPGRITQWYGRDIIKAETRLLSTYGGLIYIAIRSPISLGTFSLEFDKVIESPRYIQGLTNNADWSNMYAASKSPMVELEVPGIIFTIPRITIDKLNPNMEHLSNEYTKIMKSFVEMQGYVMPRSHRFVTDIEITHGGAHAGYPIMSPIDWEHSLFDLGGKPGTLNSGQSWGVFHEIGHEIQDKRWTPGKLGETTNNIFAEYINEKHYNSSPKGFPSLWYAEHFKLDGKKFGSLGDGGCLNIFMMVKHECSWDTFKKFFKYYVENVPRSLTPNNDENRFSTIAKVLSKMCNKNLIPFFQWWNWPVMKDAIEDTKNLPKWNGINDILENAKKREDTSDRIRSSTVYNDDINNYGPQLSIDGAVSPTNKMFFRSKNENYPWMEIKLPLSTKISSVTIVNRKDCCGKSLKNVEIRAGMNNLPNGITNQLLDINTVCGIFKGPGATGNESNIACARPILAKFITIQLTDKGILQVNELKINDQYQCLKKDNIEYYGDELGNKKTGGEDECENWCGQTQACRFWTLRKSDNWCWIKKSDFYQIINKDVLSGTRSCAASEILKAASRFVSCGGHTAADCSQCPQGHGAKWCNGNCRWIAGRCIPKQTAD